MIRLCVLAAFMVLLLVGCTSQQQLPGSTLVVPTELANQSSADPILFRDLIAAPGGVGFSNRVFYPNAIRSVVTRIEIIEPYTGAAPGSERWYVSHDEQSEVAFLVMFEPDGNGGTAFSVRRE